MLRRTLIAIYCLLYKRRDLGVTVCSDLAPAWCYKIVFGLTVLKFDDFFEWNPDTQTRGLTFKLNKRNCVHKTRAVFFSECVINVSNQIVAKAHQRANNILRCVVSRDPQSLTKAFITYVRHCLSIIVLSGRLTLSKILTV